MAAVRFAFIGCGNIARFHLRALGESTHMTKVAAAVDVRRDSAEKFSSLLQSPCEVFTSLDDALRWGKFDAAVLMVPHHLHETYAVQCLVAGKHVLLEKPLAHTLDSCYRLLEAAKGSNRVFMLGENSTHWPEVRKVKQLIESGEIGEPHFAKANYWESFGSTSLLKDPILRDPSHWRFDLAKSGGGALMDGATHWIRPLKLWFGELEEVVGVVGHPYRLSRVESLAQVLLRFTSGKIATLYCHYSIAPMHPLPFFQVFGEKGEIVVNGSFDGGMSVYTSDNPTGRDLGSQGGYSAAFTPQMEQFLGAVVGGYQLEDSGRQALGEVGVAQAVYRSLETKRWEKILPDIEN